MSWLDLLLAAMALACGVSLADSRVSAQNLGDCTGGSSATIQDATCYDQTDCVTPIYCVSAIGNPCNDNNCTLASFDMVTALGGCVSQKGASCTACSNGQVCATGQAYSSPPYVSRCATACCQIVRIVNSSQTCQ